MANYLVYKVGVVLGATAHHPHPFLILPQCGKGARVGKELVCLLVVCDLPGVNGSRQETRLSRGRVDVKRATHPLKDPNLAEGEGALDLVVKVAVY